MAGGENMASETPNEVPSVCEPVPAQRTRIPMLRRSSALKPSDS